MASATVNERVQKHRDALRMAGLRPVQIWVPDTRNPNFVSECARQCAQVTLVDAQDALAQEWMDENVADIDGWTE